MMQVYFLVLLGTINANIVIDGSGANRMNINAKNGDIDLD